jgi:hypothetical protein
MPLDRLSLQPASGVNTARPVPRSCGVGVSHNRISCVVDDAVETALSAVFRGWHGRCEGSDEKESPKMSPFIAALIACAYMGSIFVVFGLVPRLRVHHR